MKGDLHLLLSPVGFFFSSGHGILASVFRFRSVESDQEFREKCNASDKSPASDATGPSVGLVGNVFYQLIPTSSLPLISF